MAEPVNSTTRYQRSLELFSRARKVIPGGIYGHVTPALVAPGASPYYAARAEGCRYWDVDGNEYIDLMCGYGPIVLGYRHPEVEEAAEKQRRDGDCFNHPGPVMIDLADRLVGLVDFAAWAVFGKNGSDMTTWAVQVAREHTGRRKVLMVEGAYHGIGAWCTPGHGGVLPEDRAHIHAFRWNDLESFDGQFARHREDIAAVILTPFHHPLYRDSELPAPGFLQHIERRCRASGAVLVLDDVRAGFRLHVGGSHRYFDFEPDISCFSKALANGYSLSAALGRRDLRPAAGRVFLTGSFWNGAVSMAAAMATIDVLEREHCIGSMHRHGASLVDGLDAAARRHGLRVTCSGPPSMPFMTFSDETNLYRSQQFVVECLKRGLFVHPYHNWFLSAAHRSEEIETALRIADSAFQCVAEAFAEQCEEPT